MSQDLFDSFVGTFMDGTAIENVPVADRVLWSIRDNLTRLFSAREGIQPHLKNFGLPDISEIYRQMPRGIERLQDAMENAIAKYEPRLARVTIVYKENKENPLCFEFSISGEIAGKGRVTFATNLSTTGLPSVSQAKKNTK
jgi:type VI secretion system protein